MAGLALAVAGIGVGSRLLACAAYRCPRCDVHLWLQTLGEGHWATAEAHALAGSACLVPRRALGDDLTMGTAAKFLLTGIGMAAVGVVAVALWRRGLGAAPSDSAREVGRAHPGY